LEQDKQVAEETAQITVQSYKNECDRKIRFAESAQRSAELARIEAQNLKSQLSKEADIRAEQKIKDEIANLQTRFKAKETALVSYVGIFGLITAIVTILSLIRQKTFWGDFRAFWIGFWNILVFLFKNVLKGITYVSSLCDKIPQQYVAVGLHWIVFIVLFAGLGALIYFGAKKLIEVSAEPISDGVSIWNMSASVLVLLAFVFFGDFIKQIAKFNLFGFWIALTIILIPLGMYVHSCRVNRGYY